MSDPSSFTDEIRRVTGELRDGGHTHTAVNRASSAVDHLGRQLHGIGYVRDREIADCFTEVLAELAASHTASEDERRDAVQRAVHRLEAAADHAAAGTQPDRPA